MCTDIYVYMIYLFLQRVPFLLHPNLPSHNEPNVSAARCGRESLQELSDKRQNVTGWWLSHPSEKYEFVSWDDDIPNIWKVIPNSMVPVTTYQVMPC